MAVFYVAMTDASGDYLSPIGGFRITAPNVLVALQKTFRRHSRRTAVHALVYIDETLTLRYERESEQDAWRLVAGTVPTTPKSMYAWLRAPAV